MPVTRILALAALMTSVSGTISRGELILGVFGGSPAPVTTYSTSGGSFMLGQATTSGTSATVNPPTTSTNLATSNAVSQSNNAAANSTIAPSANISSVPSASGPTFDAFINLGAGPFPNAGTLTTGGAQAWYNSPQVMALFGGQPNASQQAAFDSTVLQRVEQTFQLSGVPVSLTDNPNASAAHTLSVVSGTVNPNLTSAIGMTNLGGNGFHFIDNSAPAAKSVDQLEWIVAHNVAHELMLAFGVPEIHDQTGNYIDSTAGQLAMFLNPNATFSTGAVQDLLSRDFQATGNLGLFASPQVIASASVPEPATLALWGVGSLALVMARRGRSSVSRRTA